MGDQIVKSVRRVFEVLELFDSERRPLAAVDIARKLQLPLTSTHAILKSMRALGYLSYEKSNWTYFPSLSLLKITDWVRDSIEGEVEIVDFLTALSRDTRETINLSRLVGTHVKIVFGVESRYPVGVSVSKGTMMPVTRSLTGISALACLGESERGRLIDDLKSRDDEQYENLDMSVIEGVTDALSRDGMVMRCDLFIRGIGAVCMPIIVAGSEAPLVVGIVGPSDRISERESEYKRVLVERVDNFGIRPFFSLSGATQKD